MTGDALAGSVAFSARLVEAFRVSAPFISVTPHAG